MIKRLYQKLLCFLGIHDKEYDQGPEMAEYYRVTVTCKNPNCDWQKEYSRHFSE